ncbi:MarR family transcriptional regulator [Curtobacterium flaccumfaciens]|nr:MarR family transcriptional regulator [Curtobacterium flaccumfaciens]
MPQEDEVDRIVAAWGRERDDLNFGPLEVLSRVDRLARHLDRARRAAFDESDVESWEFDVLSALRRAGEPYELSPKSLLRQTLVSSGTMTNRVDRLAARGLVARRTDPKDGRGILVSLTAQGRVAVDAAIADLLAAERDILAGVSDTEQVQLSGLLRRLILGLGD